MLLIIEPCVNRALHVMIACVQFLNQSQITHCKGNVCS